MLIGGTDRLVMEGLKYRQADSSECHLSAGAIILCALCLSLDLRFQKMAKPINLDSAKLTESRAKVTGTFVYAAAWRLAVGSKNESSSS